MDANRHAEISLTPAFRANDMAYASPLLLELRTNPPLLTPSHHRKVNKLALTRCPQNSPQTKPRPIDLRRGRAFASTAAFRVNHMAYATALLAGSRTNPHSPTACHHRKVNTPASTRCAQNSPQTSPDQWPQIDMLRSPSPLHSGLMT